VQNFTLFVSPYFKDDRIQPFTHPADRDVLLWYIRPLIEPIGPREQLLHFLESNAAPRIRSEPLALFGVEAESHLM